MAEKNTLELCEWCKKAVAGEIVSRYNSRRLCCSARWLMQYGREARSAFYAKIKDKDGVATANRLVAAFNEYKRVLNSISHDNPI